MKFVKNVVAVSGSLYIPLNRDLAAFLELKAGDEIEIRDDKNKHGKFVSFWNPKQQENNLDIKDI